MCWSPWHEPEVARGPALAQHVALASCLHPGVLCLHAASPTAPHTEPCPHWGPE